jgi:hypothetical protein
MALDLEKDPETPPSKRKIIFFVLLHILLWVARRKGWLSNQESGDSEASEVSWVIKRIFNL